MTSTVRVRKRPTSALTVNTPNPGQTAFGASSRQLAIVYRAASELKAATCPVRLRGRGQVETAVAMIQRFGCVVPVIVTAAGDIIDGHLRVDACRQLDLPVPTILVDGLSEAEVKALRVSLNRLAEQSVWDPGALAAELEDILRIDTDLIAFTGFTMPEIDRWLSQPGPAPVQAEPEDAEPEPPTSPVSQVGDLWLFAGGHKLLCGNAREAASYAALLGDERVQMIASDPPYGCAIAGHVSQSHGEFVEGSDMSEAEAQAFFASFLVPATEHLADGAIVQLFIDWAGMYPLVTAVRAAGLVQKTLCVWDKGAGGMGSLYRHQAEFVVAKWGSAAHINNIQLGKHGRNRTTVWQAPGLAQFGRGRTEALASHPTVKPIGLVADMLLDCSRRCGIVLDPFCGSGTTLLAAHRTRRLGRGIELDPGYVDVAVRRMEAATGEPARLAGTGQTFSEVTDARLGSEACVAELDLDHEAELSSLGGGDEH